MNTFFQQPNDAFKVKENRELCDQIELVESFTKA